MGAALKLSVLVRELAEKADRTRVWCRCGTQLWAKRAILNVSNLTDCTAIFWKIIYNYVIFKQGK